MEKKLRNTSIMLRLIFQRHGMTCVYVCIWTFADVQSSSHNYFNIKYISDAVVQVQWTLTLMLINMSAYYGLAIVGLTSDGH